MAPLVLSSPKASGCFEWEDKVYSDQLFRRELRLECSNGDAFEIEAIGKWNCPPSNIEIQFNCKFPNGDTYANCSLEIFKTDKKSTKVFSTTIKKIANSSSSGDEDNGVFTSLFATKEAILSDGNLSPKIRVKMQVFVHDKHSPGVGCSEEPTLEQVVKALYLNPDKSDFKIICEKEEFPCHKFVLSTRSDVFQAMLESNETAENNQGCVNIEDVAAKTMRTFLKFMYRDVVQSSHIDANLLILADKYNVKRLFNICLHHLTGNIDRENVMSILVAAYLVNSDELLRKASKFILNNRGKIKKCDNWDQIKVMHPEIFTKVIELAIFECDNEASEESEDDDIERTIQFFISKKLLKSAKLK